MADIYSRNARRYFDQYQKLSFDEVHQDWLGHLPDRPGFVLDVGAGSGRDAAALADMGWEVVSVEPAAELRALGEQATVGRSVQWVDDRLPDMSRMRSLSERFDLVLVSAVWMHVPPSERERAFRILSELLAPGGVLVMTLRHGPSPDERRFFDTSREELESFARARALVTIAASGSKDAQERQGVSWETLVFRLPDDGTGSLPLMRHIIVNDNKASTYKLGLLRTVTRIADSVPGMVLKRSDDWIEIPLGLVGLYWIKLYQPLILRHELRQLPGAQNYAFAGDVFYQLRDVSPLDLRVGQMLHPDFAVVLFQAIRDACRTVTRMPAHYIRYPGTNRQVFEAEMARMRIRRETAVLDKETLARFGSFRIPARLWDCCSRYACWLEPAIVNEWVDVMQGYEVRYDTSAFHDALRWEEGRRSTSQVRTLVDERLRQGQEVQCVWTERGLTPDAYDIDHCFPWSRWSNNDLWNLMPATVRANASKSEKLPAASLLEQSRERIEQWWEEAYVGTGSQRQFFTEAEAALPMMGQEPTVRRVFEGVAHQRMRLKMNQQLVEWYGLG